MTDPGPRYTGGCLCGALRYEATGSPLYMGYCFCADCRKASGSGFIPFIGFAGAAITFSGEVRQHRVKALRGGEAVRNFCLKCGGMVFGGEVGAVDSYTVYAGSLDDPALFEPTVAIFTRDRPDWVPLPDGLRTYETMPE